MLKSLEINECLVCWAPIEYLQRAEEMECSFCHRHEMNFARCEKGHYICDSCQKKPGVAVIEEGCQRVKSRNPIRSWKS